MKKVGKKFFQIINYLCFLIPKKRNLVIFGSMSGVYYGDNSKHLFLYMHEHMPEVVVVWLTRSRSVYKELSKLGKPVAYMQSPKGMWLLYRARVGVFTHALNDLCLFSSLVPKNIQLLSLRHGKSPKKVRFAANERSMDKHESAVREYEGSLITYVISTSEFISDIQEECLRVGREKHVVTGYPRNDIFFDGTRKKIIRSRGINVLYAPSWRHGRSSTSFFPFTDFDKQELAVFLADNDMTIYVRPHKNDLSQYPELSLFLEELACTTERISIATHDVYADINELLPDFDALITDYSSLYHDFLLTDKPMLFIPYDFEEYSHKNGFFYDYKKYLPGPCIESKEQFYYELSCFVSGKDVYKEKRDVLRKKIHYYQDNQSSQRVSGLIKRML